MPERSQANPRFTACPECRYPLVASGLALDRCPECGFDATDPASHRRRIQRIKRGFAVEVGVSLGISLVLFLACITIPSAARAYLFASVARVPVASLAASAPLIAAARWIFSRGAASYPGLRGLLVISYVAAALLTLLLWALIHGVAMILAPRGALVT